MRIRINKTWVDVPDKFAFYFKEPYIIGRNIINWTLEEFVEAATEEELNQVIDLIEKHHGHQKKLGLAKGELRQRKIWAAYQQLSKDFPEGSLVQISNERWNGYKARILPYQKTPCDASCNHYKPEVKLLEKVGGFWMTTEVATTELTLLTAITT
jgi:hypothetical protein